MVELLDAPHFVFVVAFVAAGYVSRQPNADFWIYVKPVIDKHVVPAFASRQIDSAVRTNPNLGWIDAIRKYEPQVYSQMLAELVERGSKKEEPLASLAAVRAKYVDPIIKNRLAIAHDEDLAAFIDHMIVTMDWFAKVEPQLCGLFLENKAPANYTSYYSVDLASKETQLTIRLIESAGFPKRPTLDADDMAKAYQEIGEKLAAAHGDDVQLMIPGQDRTGKEVQTCGVAGDFYRASMLLGKPRNIRFLRTLLTED